MYNNESYREYCLSKKAVTESFPFNESTLVFKVAGKMFALLSLDAPNLRVNLKCDPEWALELREQHTGIIPGFHMNKKHWNSVIMDSSLNHTLLKELTNHSYDLVVNSLTKKVKLEMGF
ncbi:MAG TPA: MmcQ/YjbR family DNA-binding protein [Lutibacter sp.]|nr:MmcQ/YjbR family DNA-binding protein [Lutibacter sp.]